MSNFIKRTGLTPKELGIIIFLLVTFCAGLIIRYSGWKKPNEYDYSQTDINFENRLKSTFDELSSEKTDSTEMIRKMELQRLADSLGIEIEDKSGEKKTVAPGTKININTALSADLRQLPGIGEVMADRIIEYRETNGRFTKVEDIMKVKGIGEKKFGEIRQFLVAE
ncbi:MAG TPA: helix-hairpin-helix domain-containing protein [Ignavibacteria bacterium]|nr:helix-hairpin-helix domain-containing protein [Ignavibacteria bacterium]